MNAHVEKPKVIATLDGLYVQGPDGFYVPHTPEETHWPIWAGMLPAIVAAWALIAGAAWAWLR